MDPDAVKRSLEGENKAEFISLLPDYFYDQFALHGMRIDAVDNGRVLCSLSVPPRLSSVSLLSSPHLFLSPLWFKAPVRCRLNEVFHQLMLWLYDLQLKSSIVQLLCSSAVIELQNQI